MKKVDSYPLDSYDNGVFKGVSLFNASGAISGVEMSLRDYPSKIFELEKFSLEGNVAIATLNTKATENKLRVYYELNALMT